MAAPIFRHGKNTRVFADTFELTDRLREGTHSGETDVAETSAFHTDAKTYVPGMTGDKLAFNGMFDDLGSDEPLQSALGGTDVTVTYFPEDAVIGREAVLAEVIKSKYEIKGGIGDMVAVAVDMECNGKAESGVALNDAATVFSGAGPVNLASVDNIGDIIDPDVASAFGGVGHLHITANAATVDSTFIIQHSDDDAVWVDLITFADVPDAETDVQSVAVAGTIERYLRASYTDVTGGTASGVVAFARKTI